MNRLIGATVVLAVLLVGCGGGPPEGALAWCARNADDVARAALSLGLMQPGQRYQDWKFSDGEYRQACEAAFGSSGE